MGKEISANSIGGFFSVIPKGEGRRKGLLSCKRTQQIPVDISYSLMSG